MGLSGMLSTRAGIRENLYPRSENLMTLQARSKSAAYLLLIVACFLLHLRLKTPFFSKKQATGKQGTSNKVRRISKREARHLQEDACANPVITAF
jgi:hypothetical protein